MIFLIILEILCSFRLFLEVKAVKEIPESSRLESLEKSFVNNFALSDAEDSTSRSLYRRGIADLPLLRTLLAICQKSRESSSWEVTDSFVSVAYVSLAALRTLLQWLLTSLSEIYFRFRRFILLVQTKILIFVNYGSSTSCRKPWRWVRLELILTMREMYINSNLNPLTKFFRRSRSTELKDILTWNMSQHVLFEKKKL